MPKLTIKDFNRPHEDEERQRRWNCATATYYPLCVSWELITQYGLSEKYTFSYHYSALHQHYVCIKSIEYGAPQYEWEYDTLNAITRYVAYSLNLIDSYDQYDDKVAQANLLEGKALLDPETWTITLVGTRQIRVPHERFTC